MSTGKRNNLTRLVQKYSGNHPIVYKIHDAFDKRIKQFAGGHKLRSDSANLSCRPFFIIGSGRSGNTLLRTILFQNPDIVIPPESYVLGKAIRRYRQLSWLEWEELCSVVISVFQSNQDVEDWNIDFSRVLDKIRALKGSERTLSRILDELYGHYGEIHKPGYKKWGDKTPINTFSLELIDRVFPDAQYIHIVRDARDVVNSYLKAGLYESVDDASHRWKSSINTIRKFTAKAGEERLLEIKYEDLVRSPEATVRQVCEHLAIEYSGGMLNHAGKVDSLGDTHLAHHQNLRKPINPSSIGKGEKELAPGDLMKVNRICKKELHELSYT